MKLRRLKRRRCVVQMRRCWINAILRRPWGRTFKQAFQQALKQAISMMHGQTPGSQLD